MTLKAEKFEEILTTELTSSLEPQRGKALAAFRAHLAAEAEKPVIAGSLKDQAARGREISRPEMWFWSSIPTVAAACLAVVVALKIGGGGPATQAGMGSEGIASRQIILSPRIDQTTTVTQVDGGILVNNNVPQRVIREQNEKTTQWQDEQAIYKLSQPGEAVKYEQVVPF